MSKLILLIIRETQRSFPPPPSCAAEISNKEIWGFIWSHPSCKVLPLLLLWGMSSCFGAELNKAAVPVLALLLSEVRKFCL